MWGGVYWGSSPYGSLLDLGAPAPVSSVVLDRTLRTNRPDAQYDFSIDSWDTPFSPLESDVASYGLRVDVREPHATVPWATFLANVLGVTQGDLTSSAGVLLTAFNNNASSTPLILDGRTPNALDYWSAGSPLWYGAGQRGKVAIHYSGKLRPIVGRSWFATTSTVTLSFALAGNGHVRCVKTTAGGVATVLTIDGNPYTQLTEADWLDQGYRYTTPTSFAVGDTIDIYYIQNSEQWGGLVAKVVQSGAPTEALAVQGPVLGCGLFDTGTQPPLHNWLNVQEGQIRVEQLQAPQATITLPLINPVLHDGFGWEWRKDSDLDPGYLVCWNGGVEQFTLRRGRLVRIKGGYANEEGTLFTGLIQDIPTPKSGAAEVKCIGFEYRLLESRNKLEPDPISYMTFGYRKLTGVFEPVYGIAAYDAWTIEDAVADSAYRAGVDASRLHQPLVVKNSDDSIVPIVFGSDAFKKFRARSKAGVALRLERPAHYGNVGTKFTESQPIDDPYLFTPEAKDDQWSRVLDIADRYGYDIRFDQYGDLLLSTRANACFAYDIAQTDSVATSSRNVHPSAYKGTYIEWAGSVTVTKAVSGARIDVSLPRGVGLAPWNTITVTRVSDSAVVATYHSVAVAANVDVFYYDYRTDTAGNNATILTLYSGDFDHYIVTFSGVGTGTRRLDTIFVYYVDPISPHFALSTLQNAIDMTPTDVGDDMRNMVTVVGARKAATTDSEKFKTNPNNPDPEFIVEAAVDAASISDPTAPNYIGMRRESTIIDSKISDQDYAAYLARTFVYRYRVPRPPAEIIHTMISDIDLRMPLTAEEAMFKSITPQSTLWVTGYTHAFSADATFTTTIATSAAPEFPSFEPRDDIDIDEDFAGVPVANVEVAYMGCSGVVQVNLPGSGVVVESPNADASVWASNIPVHAAAGGMPEYLSMATIAWPPVPGTLMIRPNVGGTGTVTEEYPGGGGMLGPLGFGGAPNIQAGLTSYKFSLSGTVNGPITSVVAQIWGQSDESVHDRPPVSGTWTRSSHTTLPTTAYTYDPIENVLTINYTGSTANQNRFDKITFIVNYSKYASRAGGRWLANTPYHHFYNIDYRDGNRKIWLPWAQGDGTSAYQRQSAVTSYDVIYRKLGAVDGSGTYVDSYGVDGSPFFDVTTSELGYVIGLTFDALVSGLYRIVVKSVYDNSTVAYLTEPTADPQQPESHWQFLTAGRGRTFNWDGVDQLGAWNQKQSNDYAAMSQGWFEAETKQAIGADWYVWNREFKGGDYGPIALISDERNADGTPTYGQGTYGAWYFQIECKNEILAARSEATGAALPRVAKTLEPAGPNEHAPTYSTPDTTAAVVYTYMRDPTQLELELADWIEPFAFDTTDPTHLNDSHWQAPWYDSNLALESVTLSATMSATTTGYTIASGSFITAGFIVGMQIMASGFTNVQNNGASIVTAVSALALTVTKKSGTVVESAGSRRLDNTFEGHINNQKPVRVRFHPVPRTGTLWNGKDGEAEIKLTRAVHLKAQIFDQFAVGEGANWKGSGFEQKTVYSRRLHNDDHTLTFVDQGWRKARTLRNSANSAGTTEWIFKPEDFKKDWGRGITLEPLHFGDYLQLEEVPQWEQQSSIAAPHSHLIAAFMSYIFYVSAYCVDRTGRRVWGVNRKFVDRYKIANNTYGQWLDPTNPSVLATKDTYQGELSYDPAHQQRRTILCRQWLDEATWQADQRTLWGFTAGSIGDLLLRHKWVDHEPGSILLNGIVWPTVNLDQHSKYHTDTRSNLPGTFSNLTRQLGANAPGSTIGSWTWESAPYWIPCVTRDFHPYFHLPPMAAPVNESNLASSYWYAMVDERNVGLDNTGRDPASAQTWSSWARDMTETYDHGVSGKVRFDPGQRTDYLNTSVGVTAKSLDYVRQDDAIHYEDLRGIYTRGERPAETPKKIIPVSPYYINMMGYGQTSAQIARFYPIDKPLPLFLARVDTWFQLAFRTEYLWESSTMFPVDYQGRETPEQINVWKSRFMASATQGPVPVSGPQRITYDSGAWTGWKDDFAPGTGIYQTKVFDTGWMPWSVGPRQGPTTESYMHLVLLNERREAPL